MTGRRVFGVFLVLALVASWYFVPDYYTLDDCFEAEKGCVRAPLFGWNRLP